MRPTRDAYNSLDDGIARWRCLATRRLMQGGARLFDNLGDPKPAPRQVQVVEAPGVTHMRYARVDR